MIDGTLVFMIFGFISVIGAIFWSEHRQTRLMNARIDELKADYQKEMAAFKADYQREMAAFKADYQREMAEFKAAYQNDMSDLKAEMRTQDERHRILEGKVDRIQGSLDVLIHTYRHESLAQPVEERQASESSVN
jgi:cell division septum initiation protein DivIVA